MVLEGIAAILRAPDQLCYFIIIFLLILAVFVHNVSAIISYDRKELLDIRTSITNLNLDENFYFNELEANDILLISE